MFRSGATLLSDIIRCDYGSDVNGYFTTGTVSQFLFKAIGHGIIKNDPESDCFFSDHGLIIDSENFISVSASCVNHSARNFYMKFLDADDKVIFEKDVPNPCPINGRTGIEDNFVSFPF